MSGTWASGWALNDIVSVGEFAKGVGCVADTTLGSGAASIDFTGLPTTYAHLLIVLYVRGDTAANVTTCGVRFNNDTAANYDSQLLHAQGAAVTAIETLGGTSAYIGDATAANAAANLFASIQVFVPHYSGASNNKVASSISDNKIGTGTTQVRTQRASCHWRSSATINRVTLIPGAGNFVTGTRATVYVMGS